jgi:putative membrane protein
MRGDPALTRPARPGARSHHCPTTVLRILLAVLHLLALGIGLGAIWARAGGLRRQPDRSALQNAFVADSLWGLAALLWISTGLWRWLGAMEKSSAYYLHNHLFHAKMGFLVLILALEVWPMVTLIRWRIVLGRGAPAEAVVSPAIARRVAAISYVQTLLVVVMVCLAVAMARGYGARS